MTANDPNEGESVNSVPLDIDEMLEAISNHRRRFTIRFVDEAETAVEADDLAEHLAAVENDGPLDAQDRKRVYVALTQHHLDKLGDLGAVAYHERSKTLMPSYATHGLADLIRYLESVCERGV
jgi:hypothetical protein